MTQLSVPRVVTPSVEEFRARFELPRRPVIVCGAARGWPALGRWTAEYLRATGGEREVVVRSSPAGAPQRWRGAPQDSFETQRVRFCDLIDDAQRPQPAQRWYLQYASLERDFPELFGDVERPAYCRRLLLSPAYLWLCGAGTVNPLHYDFNHVLMAQVRGHKRFVLLDPQHAGRVSNRVQARLYRTTAFDPAAPDEHAFPDHERAERWHCRLAPGELLFVPYRWWHHAAVDELSVSVSWWWEPNVATAARDRIVQRALSPLRAAYHALSARSAGGVPK